MTTILRSKQHDFNNELPPPIKNTHIYNFNINKAQRMQIQCINAASIRTHYEVASYPSSDDYDVVLVGSQSASGEVHKC